MCRLTVVILTFNEEKHIERAIMSVRDIASSILICDSGSNDKTVAIAKAMGPQVKIVTNPWKNYSRQFNWALKRLDANVDWVMRLDADEVVSKELCEEIKTKLNVINPNISGIYVPRRMNFLGSRVNRGGVFPIHVIRLFRKDLAKCENRWMDEHIIVEGLTESWAGEILDDNLNSLTWWIDKHNGYSNREAVDLLNLRYKFFTSETIAEASFRNKSGFKRWAKENIYSRTPAGFRAFAYFLYRVIFKFGLFDNREARMFHFFQGFWYRYLVDSKIRETERYMKLKNVSIEKAILDVLNIKI